MSPGAGPQRDGGGAARREHGIPSWPATIGLLALVVGAVGFAVSFIIDLSTAWLGGFLAAALLGLGLALAYWGRDLAGDEVISGPYPVPSRDEGDAPRSPRNSTRKRR